MGEWGGRDTLASSSLTEAAGPGRVLALHDNTGVGRPEVLESAVKTLVVGGPGQTADEQLVLVAAACVQR